MAHNSDNLRDTLRAATTAIFASWDIDIHDADDIKITQTDDNEYEALVPISGRVLLADILDDQGTLLGIKDGVAAELDGFQDDRLLVTLDLEESN